MARDPKGKPAFVQRPSTGSSSRKPYHELDDAKRHRISKTEQTDCLAEDSHNAISDSDLSNTCISEGQVPEDGYEERPSKAESSQPPEVDDTHIASPETIELSGHASASHLQHRKFLDQEYKPSSSQSSKTPRNQDSLVPSLQHQEVSTGSSTLQDVAAGVDGAKSEVERCVDDFVVNMKQTASDTDDGLGVVLSALRSILDMPTNKSKSGADVVFDDGLRNVVAAMRELRNADAAGFGLVNAALKSIEAFLSTVNIANWEKRTKRGREELDAILHGRPAKVRRIGSRADDGSLTRSPTADPLYVSAISTPDPIVIDPSYPLRCDEGAKQYALLKIKVLAHYYARQEVVSTTDVLVYVDDCKAMDDILAHIRKSFPAAFPSGRPTGLDIFVKLQYLPIDHRLKRESTLSVSTHEELMQLWTQVPRLNFVVSPQNIPFVVVEIDDLDIVNSPRLNCKVARELKRRCRDDSIKSTISTTLEPELERSATPEVQAFHQDLDRRLAKMEATPFKMSKSVIDSYFASYAEHEGLFTDAIATSHRSLKYVRDLRMELASEQDKLRRDQDQLNDLCTASNSYEQTTTLTTDGEMLWKQQQGELLAKIDDGVQTSQSLLKMVERGDKKMKVLEVKVKDKEQENNALRQENEKLRREFENMKQSLCTRASNL